MARNQSQSVFLTNGGVYASALANLQERGLLESEYRYLEYPKAVRINEREIDVEEVTEDIRGKELRRTVRKRVWDEVIVEDEDEEARVLAGGRTNAQAEDERQELLQAAEVRGLKVDKRWSTDRIKREMLA